MAHILVIEDDVAIRDLLRDVLEHHGHEVHVAADGREGLEAFHRYGADLVITDILMPDQEGLQTISELRQDNPDLKIVAVSGGGVIGSQTYLDRARDLGADRTIQKPFSVADVLAAVRELS